MLPRITHMMNFLIAIKVEGFPKINLLPHRVNSEVALILLPPFVRPSATLYLHMWSLVSLGQK